MNQIDFDGNFEIIQIIQLFGWIFGTEKRVNEI